MKNSTSDTAWEQKPQDIKAQILLKRSEREARLRETVGQSAFSFFFGNSLIFITLRVVGLAIVVISYVRSGSTLEIWPIFVIAAFLEASRANRRLDAMLELESIAEKNNQANKAAVEAFDERTQ